MPIGLGIGLNISMRGGLGGSGFSLTAPVLAFASATDPDSDNTQDFTLDVTAPAVDDVLTLQWSTTSNFAVVTGSATYTILAADLIDLTGEITTSALADGAWYFRAKMSRGATDSAWSNTVTKTITAAFSPLDLSPSLWIDPSDLSTLFQSNAGSTAASSNSDPVGYAADKSGNGFHITSTADDTTRPLLQGVGTFPYLDFDGSNDKLRRVANLALYTGGSCSIFIAVKSNPSVVANFVGEYTNNAIVSYIGNQTSPLSTSRVFIRAEDGATIMINNADITEANAFDDTDNVYGITDSGTVVTSYLDGVSNDNKSYTRSGTLVPTKFCINADLRGTGSGYMSGRLYGLICYPFVLSAPQIADVVTWLGAKMGRSL